MEKNKSCIAIDLSVIQKLSSKKAAEYLLCLYLKYEAEKKGEKWFTLTPPTISEAVQDTQMALRQAFGGEFSEVFIRQFLDGAKQHFHLACINIAKLKPKTPFSPLSAW